MVNLVNNTNYKNFIFFLICFFPVACIIGNAFVNLNVALLVAFGLPIVLVFKKKLLRSKIFYSISLFFFCLLISAYYSEYRSFSLLFYLKYLRFLIFFFIISIFFSVFKREYFDYFIKLIFIVLLFSIFDQFIQLIFGQDLFGNIYGNNNRYSGLFGNELIMGSYVSKFFFLIIPFIYEFFKKSKFYFLQFLIIPIFLFSILISGDRMPFIHFLVGLSIYYSYLLLKKKRLLEILICLGLILFSFTFNSRIVDRYGSIFHDQHGIGKLQILDSHWGAHYVTAWDIFKNNKIFGSGIKTFRLECSKDIYSKIDVQKINIRCSTHPHNIVFELLSDTGLIGLLSFGILCFLIIKNIIFEYKNIGLIIAFFIVIWPLGTSGSLFSSWNGSVVWFVLSLIYSQILKDEDTWN
jgi:O-antigen ligase